MRLFVAVFPPPEVQEALATAARALPNGPFRATAPERVHLTLKFLGDAPPDRPPRIIAALEPIRAEHEPFDVVTQGLGVFPSPRQATVLWAGFDEGEDRLRALAQTVQARLEPEGFAREDRPFVPHLTLGRARRPTAFDPAGSGLPELRFTVSGVELVQSRRGPAGVEYSALARYGLWRGQSKSRGAESRRAKTPRSGARGT